MSLIKNLEWAVGVYFKYSFIYGIVVGLLISLALASWQNNSLQKDKNCKKSYMVGNGFLLTFLIGTLIPAIGQFFLKDWAQNLIDKNA
jgi:hypothetical protein